MGLDTVELVMEIEEEFGIPLPDSDACQLQTVGQVWQYLLARTTGWELSGVCLSAATFYLLRKSFRSSGATCTLQPNTQISEVLPPETQREFWKNTAQQSGLKLPSLRCPKWIVGLTLMALLFVWGLWFYAVSIFVANAPNNANIFLTAVISSLLGMVVSALCCRIAIIQNSMLPPAGCDTIRDLVRQVLASNRYFLELRYKGEEEKAVWMKLRNIVSEQLGVAPENVHPDSHFVNDLGCD